MEVSQIWVEVGPCQFVSCLVVSVDFAVIAIHRVFFQEIRCGWVTPIVSLTAYPMASEEVMPGLDVPRLTEVVS